jgi:hypothetical protein
MTTASEEAPDIGIWEYLTEDPRPSILVDLQHPQRICFRNPTFTPDYDFENPGPTGLEQERQAFAKWVFSHPIWEPGASISYCGSTWVATTLRERWRIV